MHVSVEPADMKVIRVVGPSDAGRTTFIERLTERLGERQTH